MRFIEHNIIDFNLLVMNHDMLTWMAGPIVELRAMATTRVNDVQTEDCAVAIGRTADGALLTMYVTLGALLPKSWAR